MYITYVNHDSVIKQICQQKGNAYLINETDIFHILNGILAKTRNAIF